MLLATHQMDRKSRGGHKPAAIPKIVLLIATSSDEGKSTFFFLCFEQFFDKLDSKKIFL